MAGEILTRPCNEIHRQKSDITDHIYIAQRRAKLDAVKRHDTVRKTDKVREMQITVTLTHVSTFVTFDQYIFVCSAKTVRSRPECA